LIIATELVMKDSEVGGAPPRIMRPAGASGSVAVDVDDSSTEADSSVGLELHAARNAKAINFAVVRIMT
jgi:hypothetical protein